MYGLSKLPTPTCSWDRSDCTSIDSGESSFSCTTTDSLGAECHVPSVYDINAPLFPSAAAKLIASCAPSIQKTCCLNHTFSSGGMIEHLYFLDKFCNQTRCLLAAAQQQQKLGCGTKEEQERSSKSPAAVLHSNPNLSTKNMDRCESKNSYYRSKLELDLMIKHSSLKSLELADVAAKAEEQRIETRGFLMDQGVEAVWSPCRVEDVDMEIELEMPHFKDEDVDDSNHGLIMTITCPMMEKETIPVPVYHRHAEVENKVVDKLPTVINIESSSTPSVTSTKVEAVLATDAADSSRFLKLVCGLKKASDLAVDKDDSNNNNQDIAMETTVSLEIDETSQEDTHQQPNVENMEGLVDTVQSKDEDSLAESSIVQYYAEDDDNGDINSKDDLILIACIPKVPSRDRAVPTLEGEVQSMGGYHSANMCETVKESHTSMSERSNEKERNSSPDDFPPGDKSTTLATKSRNNGAAIPFSKALTLSSTGFYRQILCARNASKNNSGDIESPLPTQHSSRNDTTTTAVVAGETTTAVVAGEIGVTSSKEEAFESAVEVVAEDTISPDDDTGTTLPTESKNHAVISFSNALALIRCNRNGNQNDSVDIESHLPPRSSSNYTTTTGEIGTTSSKEETFSKIDSVAEDSASNSSQRAICLAKSSSLSSVGCSKNSNHSTSSFPLTWTIQSISLCEASAHDSMMESLEDYEDNEKDDVTAKDTMNVLCYQKSNHNDKSKGAMAMQLDTFIEDDPLRNHDDTPLVPKKWQSGQSHQPQSSALKLKAYRYQKIRSTATTKTSAVKEPNMTTTKPKPTTTTTTASPKDISPTSEEAASDDIEADSEPSVSDYQRCALFTTPSFRTTPTTTATTPTTTSPALVSLLDNEDVDGDELRDYMPLVHRKQQQQFPLSRQNRLNIHWNRFSTMEKTHVAQYQAQYNDDDDDDDESSLSPSSPCSLFQFRHLHSSAKTYEQLYA